MGIETKKKIGWKTQDGIDKPQTTGQISLSVTFKDLLKVIHRGQLINGGAKIKNYISAPLYLD